MTSSSGPKDEQEPWVKVTSLNSKKRAEILLLNWVRPVYSIQQSHTKELLSVEEPGILNTFQYEEHTYLVFRAGQGSSMVQSFFHNCSDQIQSLKPWMKHDPVVKITLINSEQISSTKSPRQLNIKSQFIFPEGLSWGTTCLFNIIFMMLRKLDICREDQS